MEQTEAVKKFCEVCKKEKNADECQTIDGKSYCCKDCIATDQKGEKKPAICEFC